MFDDLSQNIEALTKLFNDLALKGSGGQARGKYFFSLHCLEFALHEKLSNYEPRGIKDWLRLLFDLVNSESDEEVKQELEQPWKDFLMKVRKNGLKHIADMTDRKVRNYFRKGGSTDDSLTLGFFFSSKKLDQLDIDHMRVSEVFYWLPDREHTSRGKHPTARNIIYNIKELLNDSWHRVIKDLKEDSSNDTNYNVKAIEAGVQEESNHLPCIDFFGYLPASVKALEIIANGLVKAHQSFPKGHPRKDGEGNDITYPEISTHGFNIFYLLATNSPMLGTERKRWEPLNCYNCYFSEQDKVNFSDLFSNDNGVTSYQDFETVNLGLGDIFPKTIDLLDKWLENCNDFQQLHGDKPWFRTILENINDIENVSSLVLERLMFLLKKEKNDDKVDQ